MNAFTIKNLLKKKSSKEQDDDNDFFLFNNESNSFDKSPAKRVSKCNYPGNPKIFRDFENAEDNENGENKDKEDSQQSLNKNAQKENLKKKTLLRKKSELLDKFSPNPKGSKQGKIYIFKNQ